jgi:aminoglycoside phosphotransferase (APT) family kinase protein
MDGSVVGSAFYVMEFLRGRVFQDVRMRELGEAERTQWWAIRLFAHFARSPIRGG